MVMSWINEQRDKLRDEVSRFKNRGFMEAVVSSCALVAAADGSIDPEEKQKMMGFIRNNDALKNFKTDEVITTFTKVAGQFEFDQQIGRAEALQTVAKVKKDEAQARLVVRVAAAVAASDGNVDDSEKKALRDICHELGLDPAQFDL